MSARAAALLLIVAAACSSRGLERRVPVAASASAVDGTTVEVVFTEKLEAASVSIDAMQILAPFERPITELPIEAVEARGSLLSIETAPQHGGRLYSLALGVLSFTNIEAADYPAQVNFRGFGAAPVTIRLDAAGSIAPAELTALVTIDPSTGAYSPEVRAVPMTRGADAVFTATLEARIDPERIFAARAVTADGAEAGALTTFEVKSGAPIEVTLPPLLERIPEFSAPVDPVPGDGFAPVRIIFDDRVARELSRPRLRSSLDAAGRFDANAERVDAMTRIADQGRVYEVLLNVAVDPSHTLQGTTPDTYPYVVFLVEGDENIPQRGTTFEMVTETPQLFVIPMGNPALVPVKFRVDVKEALLEPAGGPRGKYPGEGIFLTGEFPSAEDALGRLAADAFTGGERATLEMKERPDAPGIYEKTIFMPPNRPYGWKVVRCPTGQGCAELNRHVLSSGRAFPTVMKNLVTANVDAAQSSAVKVIDPANRSRVELEGGQIADYSNARVSESGTEPPSPAVMFKQESPDLVVTVGMVPVTTPIYVVGTWRDVNIPETPLEIISGGGSIELGPYDYDDGTQGAFPLIRGIDLPDDPGAPRLPPGEPAYDPEDGALDGTGEKILDEPGRLPLWVGWNERELYLATDAAEPGRDHFILVCFDEPSSLRATHWGKAGVEAVCSRQVFLAMEGDGDFQGWFQRGTTGTNDSPITGAAARAGGGNVLEGAIDPVRLGIGAAGGHVWVAAVAFGSADNGALISAEQTPAGNGDGTVDLGELSAIELGMIRSE